MPIRTKHLLPHILEPDNLRLAVWKAGKGKRHTPAVLRYSERLEDNLLQLRRQISSGEVEIGKYKYFKIWEPKERQICAAAFDEQVLHHALMNVCHEYFERAQMFDSYASRPGKGVHACLSRAQNFCLRRRWYLKLDVRKFFDSVHHPVLKCQLDRMFAEVPLLSIFGKIIDSYEATPERGLPIGNLTSQYFANHFLSGLDVFVHQDLHVRAVVRYMDDLILWHDDPEFLQNAFKEIEQFVRQNLHCELKTPQLNRTSAGLPFLGYRIFPDSLRLTHQSQQRFFQKMKKIQSKLSAGQWDEAQAQRHVLPLLDFARRADTKNMRLKILLELE